MDWETHVVLAGKMLKACDLDVGAAIYSVLPAIDIKPIHYHRQYAHLLANASLILDAATEILGSEQIAARDFRALDAYTAPRIQELEAASAAAEANDNLSRPEKRQIRDRAYFYRRVAEQAEHFVTTELAGAIKILGEEAGSVSTDRIAAAMSLISHCYYDTFNNPVACFIPLAANYAAQWDLWKEIDYLEFRATFYNEAIITAFRRKIASSRIWTDPVEPSREKDPDARKRIEAQRGQPYSANAFTKAMIERLGSLASGTPPGAIDLSIRNLLSELGVTEIVRDDREMIFCNDIEAEISDYIREKYAA